MIVHTYLKAPGCIGGLTNTVLGITVEAQRRALRVLVVPPIPSCMIVETSMKAPECICGLINIILGMRVETRRKVLRVLANTPSV
jgi:hypothetical protein